MANKKSLTEIIQNLTKDNDYAPGVVGQVYNLEDEGNLDPKDAREIRNRIMSDELGKKRREAELQDYKKRRSMGG